MASLHIFFTTDIHGNYFIYDFRTGRDGDGSLQRAYAYVEQQRQRLGTDNVMLIDGGDMIQGGPEAYYFNHIQTDTPHRVGQMCRMMGYDAGAVGNHDIESGSQALSRFQQESGYPLLAANITDTCGGHPFKPYAVVCKAGLRVAVIGFTTPATKRWLPEELCRDLVFEDILVSARRWVAHVREKERPDLLVAVLHSGWQGGLHHPAWQENVAAQLAQSVQGIDLLLFGHDHFTRSETLRNAAGQDVACLNAGCYGYHIAEAVVRVGDGDAISVQTMIHDLRTYHNPLADRFRTCFEQPFQDILNYVSTPIGTLKSTLDISKAFNGPSLYMSLIHALQLHVSHADISLCSPYSMDQVVRSGQLTVAELFTIYWFEDRLYTIRMKGSEIRRLLERSYALWTNRVDSPCEPLLNTYTDEQTGQVFFKNLFFNFDTAAGIDYQVDVTQPEGHKIQMSRMSDGRPFEEGGEYTVATIAHRANGGGQMLTLGAGIPEQELSGRVVGYTPFDVRHYLQRYIEERGELDVELIDNWKFVFGKSAKTD